jgi:hypothetical protein
MNNSSINMNYGISMGSNKTTIIEEITGSTTGVTEDWVIPTGWIDISTVGNNEINLLVTDDSGIGFKVKIGNGSIFNTFSVDWGDGVIEHGITGNNILTQHKHTTGGTICDEGYPVWKVRIFNASEDITQFAVAKHTYIVLNQESPILWAVFGTEKITTYIYAFYGNNDIVLCSKLRSFFFPSIINGATTIDYMFYKCLNLSYVKFPENFGTISTCSYTFYSCTNLKKVVLPADNGSLTTFNSIFFGCTKLEDVTLSNNWKNVTSTFNMFYGCSSLISVNLPSSWEKVSNMGSMFENCYSLLEVNLPSSWGSSSNIQCNSMFSTCKSLIRVVLPSSWGNVTNINYMFHSCLSLKILAFPTSWGFVNSIISLLGLCKSLSSVVLPAEYNNSITNWAGVFSECQSLRTITNLEYLGSPTVSSSFSSVLYHCASLEQPITINAKLTKLGISGGLNALLKINSIRLTNATSDFSGSSPQIDISYTSMDATAINLLLGDLPTLTGKVITVKGCPGAATCDTSIATAKGWSITIS